MTHPPPETVQLKGPAYRGRLYMRYASLTGAGKATGPTDLSRHSAVYTHYLRGWLPPDRSIDIFDAGCGGGRLMRWFKELGYQRVSGVDISPEQVSLARSQGSDAMQGNVLQVMEDRQTTWDVITAMDLIEHLTKDEVLTFLDLAYAALKHHGTLILQTPNPDSPFFGTVRYGDFTHETAIAPNLLRALLYQAGFCDCRFRETEPIPRGYSLKSSVRWGGWRLLRAMIGLWNRIETGGAGIGICTRVYLLKATKEQLDREEQQ
jgi:SAM-dependent methyltransferase